MKNACIVIGVVFLLVGILGWIFREGFGYIPVYHLVLDIVVGLAGLLFGFGPKKSSGSTGPDMGL